MGRAGTIGPPNCRCHCQAGKRDLPGKVQEKTTSSSVMETKFSSIHLLDVSSQQQHTFHHSPSEFTPAKTPEQLVVAMQVQALSLYFNNIVLSAGTAVYHESGVNKKD